MLRIHPRIQAKIPYETKCQLFISKRKGTDLNDCKDSKAFIEQSNDMDDINKILKKTILKMNGKY